MFLSPLTSDILNSGNKSEPSIESNPKSPSVEGKNETKAGKPSAPPSGTQLKALTDILVSNHKDKAPSKPQSPPTQTPPPPPTQRTGEKNPVPVHKEGEKAITSRPGLPLCGAIF